MSHLIRKAVKEDMPAVLELIKELAVFEKEPNAVDVSSKILIKEGFGENPLFTCFVAQGDNAIVGMALVYFRFSTWKGRTLHLEDLIVTESQRGTGVGGALFNEVLKFAKENNVKRAEWVVLDWNENAIKFYEKSGATLLKDWYLVQMDEKGLNNY
ncbi:N-acetyltransferase [Patiriisocius marinistellae]|uniref:N-acetyltransferase n=1 Tax=Patiriisocius marinistellae TaxID=2494560 RepID=A0A5J4FVH4_9FLAO|nr:GNAT family N-acetyltransferase [Patiriisocius marinistellae]GEQ85082.1 N-acetyltransferase [Patiriisocius marinistellae]